jgi:hypothetical protein
MSRFEDTENALSRRFRALKAKPDKTLNRADIDEPLKAEGFTEVEITAVLNALEQEKAVAYLPGNRLSVLKAIP